MCVYDSTSFLSNSVFICHSPLKSCPTITVPSISGGTGAAAPWPEVTKQASIPSSFFWLWKWGLRILRLKSKLQRHVIHPVHKITDPRLSPNLERNDMILNNNSAKTNSKRLNSEKWQNKFTSQTGGEFMRVKLLISQFLIPFSTAVKFDNVIMVWLKNYFWQGGKQFLIVIFICGHLGPFTMIYMKTQAHWTICENTSSAPVVFGDVVFLLLIPLLSLLCKIVWTLFWWVGHCWHSCYHPPVP